MALFAAFTVATLQACMHTCRDRVFLIGPMGSGKTTIGRQVAEHLQLKFIDCDNELEKRTGADINLIFDIEGETGFRVRENRLLDELTQQSGILLATGGGVVVLEENRKILGDRGFIVYLEASVDKQMKRLTRDKKRPLLPGDDRRQGLEKLAKKRDPYYRELADLIVPSAHRSVRYMASRVSRAIIEFWQSSEAEGSNEDD